MFKGKFRKTLFILFCGLLITALLILAAWSLIAGPVTVSRIIKYGDTSIYDYRDFPGRQLKASSNPFQFERKPGHIPETIQFEGSSGIPMQELLESSNSIAFLVVKDDRLLDERYLKGHNAASISQLFSTSKSILSILIGAAIDDGIIQSVEEPVTRYVPELTEAGFDRVTLENLLNMQSNLNYFENDNPFGKHVIYNYTDQLEEEIVRLGLLEDPDEQFRYKSGDTALLGLALDRALGEMTITQYTQKRLWEPLGMQDPGIWGVDRQGGLERVWCCLSASARDLAKIGRLYLKNGDWNGVQIITADWVRDSTREGAYRQEAWPNDFLDIGLRNYRYLWWLVKGEDNAYATLGKDGQYLYVNPEKHLLIIRLGESIGNVPWFSVFHEIARSFD